MILCRGASSDSVLDSDTDTVMVVRPGAVALVMPVSAVDISRRRRALRAPEVAGEPDADLGRRKQSRMPRVPRNFDGVGALFGSVSVVVVALGLAVGVDPGGWEEVGSAVGG